jgi:hypothetical protein
MMIVNLSKIVTAACERALTRRRAQIPLIVDLKWPSVTDNCRIQPEA